MSGLYLEELVPGTAIDHDVRKTVTETDNMLYCAMTLNVAPIHIDAQHAAGTQFGERLVNSLYTLGLVCGITATDTTLGTTIANLGFSEVKFPAPLFHGDTVRVRTEIVDRRDSKTSPDRGIVNFRHIGYNQRDEIVCDCTRAALMLKAPTSEPVG